MAWMMFIAALWIGADAAAKLSHHNPMPVAWFEAGMTAVLVIGAVVLIALGRDE